MTVETFNFLIRNVSARCMIFARYFLHARYATYAKRFVKYRSKQHRVYSFPQLWSYHRYTVTRASDNSRSILERVSPMASEFQVGVNKRQSNYSELISRNPQDFHPLDWNSCREFYWSSEARRLCNEMPRLSIGSFSQHETDFRSFQSAIVTHNNFDRRSFGERCS